MRGVLLFAFKRSLYSLLDMVCDGSFDIEKLMFDDDDKSGSGDFWDGDVDWNSDGNVRGDDNGECNHGDIICDDDGDNDDDDNNNDDADVHD